MPCATLEQQGQQSQAPQLCFCGSHCLALLPHFPWKMASVFPTRWVTGQMCLLALLSLACREHLLRKARSHGQSRGEIKQQLVLFAFLLPGVAAVESHNPNHVSEACA